MKTFTFAVDPTGELGSVMAPQFAGGNVTVTADVVHVQMGTPTVFDMIIPRTAIASLERAPDLERITRGVHGWRGRWLVNQSGVGLVKLTLTSRLPATLNAKPGSIPALESAGRVATTIANVALRERTLRISELTIALEDPDAFIVALSGSV